MRYLLVFGKWCPSFRLSWAQWGPVAQEPTFSFNPAKSPTMISNHSHYLIGFPTPPRCLNPGLPSAGILSGGFSQNPPLTLMVPLGNFPSRDCHWLLGHIHPLFPVPRELSPISLPSGKTLQCSTYVTALNQAALLTQQVSWIIFFSQGGYLWFSIPKLYILIMFVFFT